MGAFVFDVDEHHLPLLCRPAVLARVRDGAREALLPLRWSASGPVRAREERRGHGQRVTGDVQALSPTTSTRPKVRVADRTSSTSTRHVASCPTESVLAKSACSPLEP